MQITDQTGQILNIKTIPKRIISLVPSQTELLFDLGLENSIIGITKFCIHPKDSIKSKQIVGGTKNIKIDKILALQPDIILCNKEENTKEIAEACKHICPVHISDIFNIEDAKKMIKDYGQLFNKGKESRAIIKKIDLRLNDFQLYIKEKPVLKVAYFIWRNPWMAAGNNTFINYLLELNQFENIYSSKERYPEIDIKNLSKEKSLEVILLSSEPYPFKNKHVNELESLTQNLKIVFVNGELFSWYGTRLLKSFDYFKKLRESIE